ncbi:hypothetical protein [Metabacillus arenae]|uniref:Uncharacterized protein n=1 Tax=Metabacillus arenae TaxID=2771434 RepID=A0A926S110_9BACI|nr:hypothetical protein [Metabacillus arenae]MBD1380554.1 hypothetical protein [Metabacillus arenae]
MKELASQTFVIVKRIVEWDRQIYKETEYSLLLFEDRVISHHHQFLLRDVFDMSFKPMSGKYGFLYLHTNQGVFAYQVLTHPQAFIDTFKSLKKS